MFMSNILGLMAAVVWIALVLYVVVVLVRRSRGDNVKISLVIIAFLLLLAVFTSTLSAGLVVVDAGEVGVVFNSLTGTTVASLFPETIKSSNHDNWDGRMTVTFVKAR